jgi:hypothetical protein
VDGGGIGPRAVVGGDAGGQVQVTRDLSVIVLNDDFGQTETYVKGVCC